VVYFVIAVDFGRIRTFVAPSHDEPPVAQCCDCWRDRRTRAAPCQSSGYNNEFAANRDPIGMEDLAADGEGPVAAATGTEVNPDSNELAVQKRREGRQDLMVARCCV